jgi:hypothetical protein
MVAGAIWQDRAAARRFTNAGPRGNPPAMPWSWSVAPALPRALRSLSVGVLLLAGACKQGEGDRCEVDNDCEAPLRCENVTESKSQGPSGHCGSGQTTGPPRDAAVDAPRLDTAAPADASRDAAAPDLTPDVTPDGSADASETHFDGASGG